MFNGFFKKEDMCNLTQNFRNYNFNIHFYKNDDFISEIKEKNNK